MQRESDNLAGAEAIHKPWQLWASWREKYGDVVRLDIVHPLKFVLLCDPPEKSFYLLVTMQKIWKRF